MTPFPYIWNCKEVLLDWDLDQILPEYLDLQTATSVWTSRVHHLKRSRCGQSSGALSSGFWLYWLGSSWQGACHVWYHHWRWQRIQRCYYQSMHTPWTEWLVTGSSDTDVAVSEVDLNHNVAAIHCFLFIFEAFCLLASNKYVLFEVGVILQLIHWLCLCSHLKKKICPYTT